MAKSNAPLNADERKKLACPTALCPYPADLDHYAYPGRAYNQLVRELIESTKIASGVVDGIAEKLQNIDQRYGDKNRIFVQFAAAENLNKVRKSWKLASILAAASDYAIARHLVVNDQRSQRAADSDLVTRADFQTQLAKFKPDVAPYEFHFDLSRYARDHAQQRAEWRPYVTGDRYDRALYEMKEVIPKIVAGHELGEDLLSGFVADYACGGSLEYRGLDDKITGNTLFGSSIVLLAGAIKANGTAEAPENLKLNRHDQLSQIALDLLPLEQCKTRGDIPGVDTLRACAVTLWGLGRRNHKESLKLMRKLRILDEKDELVRKGFFNRLNFESAVAHIRATLEQTRQRPPARRSSDVHA